jgi:hypothetical protein
MNTIFQIWIEHNKRPSQALIDRMRVIKNYQLTDCKYHLVATRNYFAGLPDAQSYEWINVREVITQFKKAYPDIIPIFDHLLPEHQSDMLRCFICMNTMDSIYVDADIEIAKDKLEWMRDLPGDRRTVLASNLPNNKEYDASVICRGSHSELFFSSLMNVMIAEAIDLYHKNGFLLYGFTYRLLNQFVVTFGMPITVLPYGSFVHHKGE